MRGANCHKNGDYPKGPYKVWQFKKYNPKK